MEVDSGEIGLAARPIEEAASEVDSNKPPPCFVGLEALIASDRFTSSP
jgi:hypothetical protein